MISLKGIEKVYNSGTNVIHALKDVTFDVESGEMFGIIGRSGSGKSTLARCMNLLERPSSGSIIIDNCPITALGTEGLRLARQKIALLTKHPFLLSSKNVYDNVALPLEFAGQRKSEIRQIVQPLLNLLNLSESAFPADLSLGQKQKVALARAIAQQPKVLICDDATQQLDSRSAHSLFQNLRDLNEDQKLTVLYITHDMDTIKILCQRIAILHQGEIVEQGALPKVFVNPASEIAKEMVKTVTRLEIPSALRRRLRSEPREGFNPVLRMSFLGSSGQEPLIAYIIQQFSLNLHIMQAHLETIHNETLGIMIVEIMGHKDNIQNAIQFLEDKELHVEVLGYVPRSD